MLDYFERRGEVDVVCIGLKCQTQDGYALVFYHPKRLADFFKITVNALLVDAFSGFQDVEIHTDRSRQVDERLHVLRKTETTVAKPGLEELSADACVESHGMRHFLDIGADFFAEIGDYIGVADFQREKRIGSMLDELGAIDGGDEEFRLVARRTGSIVHRAAKTLFKDGAVNLPEFGGGRGILNANDNTIGVEKIIDGCALAKKLGIRSDAVPYVGVLGVSGAGAAEFETRARWDGAFLDDEFGRFGFGGDLAGDMVDSGKVGFTGILGRGAHADENGLTCLNCFAGVRSV